MNDVICHLFLARPILSVLNDVIGYYIQDLNSHLSTGIFMTGYKLSLADVLVLWPSQIHGTCRLVVCGVGAMYILMVVFNFLLLLRYRLD